LLFESAHVAAFSANKLYYSLVLARLRSGNKTRLRIVLIEGVLLLYF